MATENNTLDETFIVPFDSINNDDSFRVNSPVDMNDNLHEIYEKCTTFNFCTFKSSDHDAGDFDNNIDPDNNLYNDIDLKCNYYPYLRWPPLIESRSRAEKEWRFLQ